MNILTNFRHTVLQSTRDLLEIGVNLPAAECRFLKNSAEGHRWFICRSRRLMNNLCRISEISFTILQKKEEKKKNIPWSPSKQKLTLIKVGLDKVLMYKYFIYFQLLSARCVIQLLHTLLREKCPNTELFLSRIFLYSDWIRRFTK